MKDNKLRTLLNSGKPSVATRMWSTWPFFTELLGATGNFDYVEFVAEYSPFTQHDLENLARAAELHQMGTMIKVDFVNNAYVAQKAIASGFQSIMFADLRTPEQVENAVKATKPGTPDWQGFYGYPTRRFIGTQSHLDQLEHAKRLGDIVLCFMIERIEAMQRIDDICSIPGVDMVQFGPADYSMSQGWNAKDHRKDTLEAEREMIRVALKHGVQPRCEIQSPEDAKYYMDLGVRHFCLGDQCKVLKGYWETQGAQMKNLVNNLS
ncbi:MAG: HpcH/HpaI aldolase family protein [Christensenellales bacterium]|jgi:2-keto-3-deoxy-L-rhamnonate aldolase RhmA